MPMDFEQAFGKTAEAPRPTPKPGVAAVADTGPSGGMSFEQAFGKTKSPEATTRQKVGIALDATGNAAARQLIKFEDATGYTSWYNEFSDTLNDFLGKLKGDVAPDKIPPTITNSVKRLARIGIHGLGAISSPATALLDTAAVQPVQKLLGKLSGQLEQAFPSYITPEDRREAGLRGEQPKVKYPEGINWKIHKEDIAQTAKSLQQAWQAFVYSVPLGEMAAPAKAALGLEKGSSEARLAIRDFNQEVEPKPTGLKPVTFSLDHSMGFKPVSEALAEQLKALPPGSTRSAGVLLDDMEPHAEGYAKAFIQKLKEHINPSTPVTFKAKLPGDAWGNYESTYKKINISTEGPEPVHTIIHEMTHAVTLHIMDDLLHSEVQTKAGELGRPLTPEETMQIVSKPKSPLLRELDGIIAEARLRAMRAGKDFNKKAGYGLAGDQQLRNKLNAAEGVSKARLMMYGKQLRRYEFVAELFSNPDFQEFLANSEKYASPSYKIKNMLNQFGVMIGRHLGFSRPHELQLLNQAFKTGSQLMKLQSERGGATRDFNDVIVSKLDNGEVITKGDMDFAVKKVGNVREMKRVRDSLKISIEQILRSVAPESLGPKALLSASVISSRVTEMMQKTSAWRHGSKTRLKFWRGRPDLVKEFTQGFERGVTFKDPVLNDMARRYREWNQKILEQDQRITGLEYEPRDNYLYHVFEDSEAVSNYFTKKYGSKWGDPSFIKDRTFDLYEEAIAAGFVPKYDNPEDIMLARQQASDLAYMHSNILKDMEKYKLATLQIKGENKLTPVVDSEGKMRLEERKTEGNRQPPNTTRWRAPNGKVYWVDNKANVLLQNAFRSKSLWEDKGAVGLGFRSMMLAKNLIVPIRLSLSLFHPLHVAGIDIAAGYARATTGLLSGSQSVPEFVKNIIKSSFGPVWQNPKMGWRMMQVWKGHIPKELLTDSDAESLKHIIEGGMIPEISTQYRTNARQNFANAVRDMQASFRLGKAGSGAVDAGRAVWHAPWALLSAMGAPVFEHWIPQLKTASYLNDVKNLLGRNPELIENDAARQVALRKLAKSVDNRYGEMAYNNLFWKRWVKDLAVLNTLSLGWQMGFIREYGGGAIDVGQFLRGEDKLKMIKAGKLDRPVFVAAYTTLGALTGGLMTWAMTGEYPNSLLDFVDPRTGGTDENGNPRRVSTMFYSREFASLYKHIENEGLVHGLSDLVLNKGSGLFGLMHEWYSGVNSFGEEIRDPSHPMFQQLEETLAYTLSDIEPITMKAMVEQISGDDKQGKVLAALGFTPAPKYLTESKTQGNIISAYRRYVAPANRPFDRVLYANEYNKLRKMYQEGDPGYGELLDKMSEQYDLSAKDQRRLIRTLNSTLTGTERMFIQLPWTEQKKILDAATPEERDALLPHANKEHLRNRYEPPDQ